MFSNVLDDDENDEDVNWDNLKTITTFDGLDNNSHELQTKYKINNNVTKSANNRLLNGEIINEIAAKATTPVSLLVESLVQQLCTMLEPDRLRSTKLYNSICEQLHQMNLIDETFSMGEFEMMRSQYQKALYQLVSVARGQELPISLQNVWPLNSQAPALGIMDWSRYYREFDEVKFIAGGGFGKVFKARHKLDGIEYAVKKITIKSTTINHVLHHLSEVKTLAGLNHVNIVPYKAAWLEPLIANSSHVNHIKKPESSDSDEEDDDDEDYPMKSDKSSSSSSDFIEFRNSNDELDTATQKSSYISDTETESISQISTNKILAKFKPQISIEESQPHLKLKWATLYIQMTLCQLTLREWLDARNKQNRFDDFYENFLHDPTNKTKYHNQTNHERNLSKLFHHTSSTIEIKKKPVDHPVSSSSSDEGILTEDVDGNDIDGYQNHPTHLSIVSDIFSQMLNGLHYIHSRGIVHHDIKPSNIFVALEHNGKMTVQLGDFGLACPLQNTSHSTQGFGTPLYAAPEQLNGECNPKSDIYSLGIILLELLLPFQTDMERVDMIKKIRSGNFPKQVNETYSNLLKRLLSHHRKRPDTFQLVEIMNRLNSTKDNLIFDLQKRLSDQEVEINLLKNRSMEQNELKDEILKQKDLEIIELKKRILRLEDKESNQIKSKENEIQRLKDLLKSEHSLESKSNDANCH